MVAMSAKLEPTPQPCATVRLYEDEIRSVEGRDRLYLITQNQP